MDRFFEANAVLAVFCKNYMDLKKNLPIRPSEMGVLNIITQTPGPHTSVMLAELLRVSKPMITAHLTSLLEKGYVIKKQSPDDGRIFHILPTEKAHALVARFKEDIDREFAGWIDVMGEEAFDQFVSLAKIANKVMESGKGERKEWRNATE